MLSHRTYLRFRTSYKSVETGRSNFALHELLAPLLHGLGADAIPDHTVPVDIAPRESIDSAPQKKPSWRATLPCLKALLGSRRAFRYESPNCELSIEAETSGHCGGETLEAFFDIAGCAKQRHASVAANHLKIVLCAAELALQKSWCPLAGRNRRSPEHTATCTATSTE